MVGRGSGCTRGGANAGAAVAQVRMSAHRGTLRQVQPSTGVGVVGVGVVGHGCGCGGGWGKIGDRVVHAE